MKPFLTTLVLSSIFALGCGQAEAPAAEPEAPAAEAASDAPVVVAADGTRFDPARQVSEMPEGAWVCDMGGSVHYASQSEGSCPVCGMALTQVGGAPAAEGGHGH